jgi:hypothetical protein
VPRELVLGQEKVLEQEQELGQGLEQGLGQGLEQGPERE